MHRVKEPRLKHDGIQARSQDFCKGGYMGVWYVCMYNQARLGGSGVMLPRKFLEIRYHTLSTLKCNFHYQLQARSQDFLKGGYMNV